MHRNGGFFKVVVRQGKRTEFVAFALANCTGGLLTTFCWILVYLSCIRGIMRAQPGCLFRAARANQTDNNRQFHPF